MQDHVRIGIPSGVWTSEDPQAFQTMSATPSSRKRKRGVLDENESGSLSIELSGLSDTQVGPVLGVCGYFFFKSVFWSTYLPGFSVTQRAFHVLYPPKTPPSTSS